MGRVDGKVVIITGAGEGLGRTMAQLFTREGAQVVLAARRPEPLEETRALVRAEGRDALVVPTDVVIREESTKGAALRKVAEPEETAQAALFLASDESSAITGQSVVVDSGVHMYG